MFPHLPARATLVAVVSETQKMFLIVQKHCVLVCQYLKRFWEDDDDVYKQASLGKRAPSFPPKTKLKQMR